MKNRIYLFRQGWLCFLCVTKRIMCFVYGFFWLSFAVLLSTGCVNSTPDPKSRSESECSEDNIYFESLVDACIKTNDKITREEAREIIRSSLLRDVKPVSEVIGGTIKKVVVEEYINLHELRYIGEFDGNSEHTAIVRSWLCEGAVSFGKIPRGYVLSIFSKDKDVVRVHFKGGLFGIEGVGLYISEKNLENEIMLLINQGVQDSKTNLKGVGPIK